MTEPAATNPPTPADDLLTAAHAFFPAATAIAPVPDRPHLARVDTEGGSWCVRRWPPEAPPERIAFVHALLRTAADAGITFVPTPAALAEAAGDTLLRLGEARYDAVSWLPGRSQVRTHAPAGPAGSPPDLPSPLGAQGLAEVAASLARFHAALDPLARRRDVPALPLPLFMGAVRQAWYAARDRLRPIAPRTPHVQRWLRAAERVVPAGNDALAAAEFLRPRPRVVAHLNLWPAHVLTARREGAERLTGLLDFASAAASSPLVDLAQVVTHFDGWSAERAEIALASYTDGRALTPEERRLLPVLAALDLVAETARVLILTYDAGIREDTPGAEALRAASAALVTSLETVAPLVLRHDRPDRPHARRWVHRPKPAGSAPRSSRPHAPRSRSDRHGPTRRDDQE